jgi:hypothetical protein
MPWPTSPPAMVRGWRGGLGRARCAGAGRAAPGLRCLPGPLWLWCLSRLTAVGLVEPMRGHLACLGSRCWSGVLWFAAAAARPARGAGAARGACLSACLAVVVAWLVWLCGVCLACVPVRLAVACGWRMWVWPTPLCGCLVRSARPGLLGLAVLVWSAVARGCGGSVKPAASSGPGLGRPPVPRPAWAAVVA